MYVLYILWLREFATTNSLLLITPDISVRSETLRIFSSGKDAARINQQRCFGSARNSRHQKCTWMYTFDDATTPQMHRIFQKDVALFFSYDYCTLGQ